MQSTRGESSSKGKTEHSVRLHRHTDRLEQRCVRAEHVHHSDARMDCTKPVVSGRGHAMRHACSPTAVGRSILGRGPRPTLRHGGIA